MQLFAELTLGDFPIHKLLLARRNQAIPFGENLTMPSRGHNVMAGKVGPQFLH